MLIFDYLKSLKQKQEQRDTKPILFESEQRAELVKEFTEKGLSKDFIENKLDYIEHMESLHNSLYLEEDKTWVDSARDCLDGAVSNLTDETLQVIDNTAEMFYRELGELDTLYTSNRSPNERKIKDIISKESKINSLQDYIRSLREFIGYTHFYKDCNNFDFITPELKEKAMKVADLLEEDLQNALKNSTNQS